MERLVTRSDIRMQPSILAITVITAMAGLLSNSSITLLDVRWCTCGISVVGARLIMKSAVGQCDVYVKIGSV